MKTFFKILGFTVLGILVLLYLGFLFVLPNAIDLNKYKPDVQKLAKEQANLNVDFQNVKIITTPLLGVGIKASDINVKLPDNSVLFSADNFKTRVALPSLLLMTVKVSCLELNQPFVNLEILNDKQYKVVSLVEDILNRGKEQTLEDGLSAEIQTESWFNPEWIRIKVPNITLNNYKVLVNDLKTGHKLALKGEKLKLGYFNKKILKVKTYAEVFNDENKNITLNINLNTFLLPPAPGLDEEDDRAKRVEFPFVNSVTMFRMYNPKADLDLNMRVRNSKNGVKSYGHFNLDGLTLNVSNIVIPVSYIHVKTFGSNANIDTDLYLSAGQNLQLLGSLNYGTHPKMDMSIKSATIKFNDMLNLAKAFLNSLGIKHELGNYSAVGSIKADCYIKTNFKKLKSTGSIIIKDGGIIVRGMGRVVSNANINLLLDNDILDVKDSSVFVNNSKIFVNGKIDEKSIADITVKTERVSVASLFNAFAPRALKQAYNFRSGDIAFEISVKGELKKAIATLKAKLENLYIIDKSGNFTVKNAKLDLDFFCNAENLAGKIKNEGLNLLLPKTGSNISAPLFEVDISEGNLIVKENKLNIGNTSSVVYSGEIVNYMKPKTIQILVNGKIATPDLVRLIGQEFKQYLHTNGIIPIKITIDGNMHKQTLFFQALTDKTNFITPVDFSELLGKNISLQSVIDFKGNRIKIKKTGFFERIVTIDEEGNEVVNLNEILGVDGTIVGKRINLLKITMPQSLTGKIFVFPRSRFTVDGKAFIFGEVSNPRIRGGFNISNLSIPELMLTLRRASIRFRGGDVDFAVEDLIANGSDVQAHGNFRLVQSGLFTISHFIVNSRYINIDKLMKVADSAMKYVPQSNSGSTSANTTPAEIPLVIARGSANLRRLVSGNINIENINSRIRLRHSNLFLNNITAQIFDGSVNGDISVDLLSMLLDIDMHGENINVAKAMLDAAGMKDMLSGIATFNSKLSIQGATMEEQMKSLKGEVDFVVVDGQFGPFGKLENLILAENIRESKFFETTIGGMLSGLLTIDTTHFSELKGNLSFSDGICHIDPITSSGDILALHLFGDFDLLQNQADMKVRARMASLVSNLLGPLNAINPINLVNSAASLNVVTAKAFSLFCETVPQEEIAILPSFANKYVDNSATKFQIVVRGDVAKPLKLVKSFKWLTTPVEFQRAKEFADAIPEPEENSTATNIEEVIEEQNSFQYKTKTKMKSIKNKLLHPFSNSDNNKEEIKTDDNETK